MRSAWLDVTLIIPATACHQRIYVERYSRYKGNYVNYDVGAGAGAGRSAPVDRPDAGHSMRRAACRLCGGLQRALDGEAMHQAPSCGVLGEGSSSASHTQTSCRTSGRPSGRMPYCTAGPCASSNSMRTWMIHTRGGGWSQRMT